jgi:integrase
MGARGENAIPGTDASIRGLKPRATRYDVGIRGERGLRVRVSPSNEKTFAVAYRTRTGKVKTFTIGRYPMPVSLADARKAARERMAEATLGGDPQGERVAAREAARRAVTFLGLAEGFLEAKQAKLAANTLTEYHRMVRAYLCDDDQPSELAQIPAASVTPDDIERLLESVAARAPIMANRLFQFLRAVCRRGLKKRLLTQDPCTAVERPRPERSRERVLNDAELTVLWAALKDAPVEVAVLVRLLALLGQRSTETVEMRWADLAVAGDDGRRRPAGVDLWTIPGRYRKGGRLHVVPLPRYVVRLLDSLPRHGERVFPGISEANAERDWWGAVRDRTLALASERGLAMERFTKHDLRRSAMTGMTRLGATRFIAQRVIGHKEPGVGSTYDRYD